MGCNILFAGICENPEYYKKRINYFVAMAPAISIYHSTSTVVRKMKLNPLIHETLRQIGPEMFWKAYSGDTIMDYITS